MTKFSLSSSRWTFSLTGACALLLASGCSTFRSDPGQETSRSYQPPRLDVLEEAPPIAYSEVYVPVDAHAYQKDGKKLPLSATLVLRNPNRAGTLVVKKVDLYGQDGRRMSRVAEEPFELRPFASVEFLAGAQKAEGKGREKDEDEVIDLDVDPNQPIVPSHFIVQWGTTDNADPPLVETVMVDGKGQILYARPGHEIRKIPAQSPATPRPQVRRMDIPAQSPVHASVAPKYELIHYDSNMGLRSKDF